jgi:hypothetical protein
VGVWAIDVQRALLVEDDVVWAFMRIRHQPWVPWQKNSHLRRSERNGAHASSQRKCSALLPEQRDHMAFLLCDHKWPQASRASEVPVCPGLTFAPIPWRGLVEREEAKGWEGRMQEKPSAVVGGGCVHTEQAKSKCHGHHPASTLHFCHPTGWSELQIFFGSNHGLSQEHWQVWGFCPTLIC